MERTEAVLEIDPDGALGSESVLDGDELIAMTVRVLPHNEPAAGPAAASKIGSVPDESAKVSKAVTIKETDLSSAPSIASNTEKFAVTVEAIENVSADEYSHVHLTLCLVQGADPIDVVKLDMTMKDARHKNVVTFDVTRATLSAQTRLCCGLSGTLISNAQRVRLGYVNIALLDDDMNNRIGPYASIFWKAGSTDALDTDGLYIHGSDDDCPDLATSPWITIDWTDPLKRSKSATYLSDTEIPLDEREQMAKSFFAVHPTSNNWNLARHLKTVRHFVTKAHGPMTALGITWENLTVTAKVSRNQSVNTMASTLASIL